MRLQNHLCLSRNVLQIVSIAAAEPWTGDNEVPPILRSGVGNKSEEGERTTLTPYLAEELHEVLRRDHKTANSDCADEIIRLASDLVAFPTG